MENLYHDDLYQINRTHVCSIMKLIHSKKPNGMINLPGEIKAIKEYSEIRFVKEIENFVNYEIELVDFVELPKGHNITKVENEEKNDNNVCRLLSSEIDLPLFVRTRRLGDSMILKKINGKRKIKDIFIDSKIPLHQRDSWPVVVDSKGRIIWIPGIKKSKFSKQKAEKYDIIFKYN